MPTLIFVWLLTATAGALYLGQRLLKDYRAARYYTRNRMMFLRFTQGFRRASHMMLSSSGYEKTAERMRLF
jgi:hypothetical protein